MAGSLLDDLARAATTKDVEPWVTSERFRVRYFPAIVQNDDGTERSVWKGKWTLPWLLAERSRSPRSFAKNFMNAPLPGDSPYFDPADFRYGPVEPASFVLLSIDPAVSTKSKSDFTGFCVIAYSRSLDQFGIRHSSKARLNNRQLRARVELLLEQYPEVTAVLVETNQGGENMVDEGGMFAGLPNVKIITVHQKVSKELRAEMAAIEFGHHRVLFADRMPEIERQLAAFPAVMHDDDVDALTSAVIEVRKRTINDRKPKGLVAKRVSYAG
jgi:predicted phage terminase large subunit-like protein